MFPSTTYSTGPYPCFPSSSSYPLFPFLNPENASAGHNTLLHDPLCVPYIPTHNNAPIPETLINLATVADTCANSNTVAASMPKQDPSGGAHYGISCLLTKKPAKKDRHSKIYTAQGLRDRRVRLSIEIARKFFDLQDMLGFDKASNTLDWLFTKSKKAIKELARSKHSGSEGANNSFSSSSDCEDCEVVSGTKHRVAASADDAQNLQQGLDSNEKSLVDGDAAKERKLKRAQKEPASSVRAKMKESREKARARARERTSNKMCNNNNTMTSGTSGRVQDLKKKCPAPENPQILHQLRSPLQLEDCARSPNKMVHPHTHLVGGEAPRDDFNVIEESIVIKRKLKPSLMSSSHHHQNLVIPKEANFNNNNNNSDYHSNFPNLSPNWDANGATASRSNFCAIASVNLSTGMCVCFHEQAVNM